MELISKKKLLETIEPMVGKFDDDGEFWWSRESILRAINNAPTVEERKEGRWETVNFKTIPTGRISKAKKCSECGKRKDKYVVWNFCPNCGAKIQGE